MLGVEEVEIKVIEIAAKQLDSEAAHSMEDDLWRMVLTQIAVGHPDPSSLAKAALKTTELDFARWCA